LLHNNYKWIPDRELALSLHENTLESDGPSKALWCKKGDLEQKKKE